MGLRVAGRGAIWQGGRGGPIGLSPLLILTLCGPERGGGGGGTFLSAGHRSATRHGAPARMHTCAHTNTHAPGAQHMAHTPLHEHARAQEHDENRKQEQSKKSGERELLRSCRAVPDVVRSVGREWQSAVLDSGFNADTGHARPLACATLWVAPINRLRKPPMQECVFMTKRVRTHMPPHTARRNLTPKENDLLHGGCSLAPKLGGHPLNGQLGLVVLATLAHLGVFRLVVPVATPPPRMVTCVLLMEARSAQHGAHADHKKEGKACQEPNTVLGAFRKRSVGRECRMTNAGAAGRCRMRSQGRDYLFDLDCCRETVQNDGDHQIQGDEPHEHHEQHEVQGRPVRPAVPVLRTAVRGGRHGAVIHHAVPALAGDHPHEQQQRRGEGLEVGVRVDAFPEPAVGPRCAG